MSEHSDPSAGEIIAIERLLLIALCHESLPPRNREETLRRLGSHAFRNPEHEVLFLALTKVSGQHREGLRAGLRTELRAEVGASLTRLGFPGFDLDPFFNPVSPTLPLTVPEVAALLQRL